jgi:hypothetical protein
MRRRTVDFARTMTGLDAAPRPTPASATVFAVAPVVATPSLVRIGTTRIDGRTESKKLIGRRDSMNTLAINV